MRAYFAPCGVGLGHAGRCVPIARRLSENGSKVLFSTYGDAIGLVRHERFPILESPPLLLDFGEDGALNVKWSLLKYGVRTLFTVLEQVNSEIRGIREFSPDIVVSDTRISTIIAAKMLRIPVISILNQFQVLVPRERHLLTISRLVDTSALTFVGTIWSLSDCILIPDLPPPFTVSVANLQIPETLSRNVELIGPILERKSQDLPESEKIRKKLGFDDRPLMLVSLGGSPAEVALRDRLVGIASGFPEDIQMVASLGQPAEGIGKILDRGSVRIYSWIPFQFEMIKACDVLVARAGHSTIMQAVGYGKPMILVPIPNHTEQMGNAVGAQRLGIARLLRQEAFNRETLLSETRQILEDQSYVKRAADIGRFAQRFDAVGQVVKVAQKILRS